VPVISVVKDAQARTLTVTARFDAPIGRVWQVWSDPRQLERWWGPPSYPATVLEHDPAPGGTISYVLTGADGERHGGWFGVRAADPPHMLELDAGFADADGNPIPDGPTAVIRVALSELVGDATQMTITTTRVGVARFARRVRHVRRSVPERPPAKKSSRSCATSLGRSSER